MAVSYKKLWHLLIDRDMKKKDLEAAAGINHYTMKMSQQKCSVKFVLRLTAKWKIQLIFFLTMTSKNGVRILGHLMY